jgi:hypothetical protein
MQFGFVMVKQTEDKLDADQFQELFSILNAKRN